MLPLTRVIPKEFEEVRTDISDMYEELAQGINGDITSWTPNVYGSTTAGSPTYTIEEGYYVRQGVLVDLFISVHWSNSGTSAGNISMKLPFSAALTNSNVYIGTMHINNSLSLSANYTYAALLVTAGTNVGVVNEFGSGQAAQPLTFTVSGTGGFSGHLRYVAKDSAKEGRT